MTHRPRIFALFGAVILIAAGVAVQAAPAQAATRPPSTTLTSPTGGQVFTIPGTMRLAATASDPDGAVDVVQTIGSARVTVTMLDGPGDPVANPYQGAAGYVDPDWSGHARAQAAATPGDLGRQMTVAAGQPTAVWLDSVDAITAGRGLVGHLDAALAQQQASGAAAMAVQLVLYNIPGRDCMQRAAPGGLTVEEFHQRRYRTAFIDPIVEILGRPEYADLRVVTVVEPHALASLVLAQGGGPVSPCVGMADPYRTAVRYALARLATLDNTYAYLDASFSGLLGYPDNLYPTAALLADVVLGAGGPGAGSVTGFVTNVGQYAPLTEPLIPNSELVVGGQSVYTSRFFDWNREIHERDFAQRLRDALISRGFPATIGIVIDTSRNGWGGPDRPTAPSTSTDLNTFVDQSRIDRRPTRISWCNQGGSGIGARPRAAPAAGLHAYAWLTPPGVSDGVADRATPPDPDRPYLRHRDRCDPLFQEPRGAFIPSNALPGAPHRGHWFPDFFAQLVSNAYPPFPVSTGPSDQR